MKPAVHRMIAISSIKTEQNSIKDKWKFTSQEKILILGRDCNLLDPNFTLFSPLPFLHLAFGPLS